MAHAPALGCQNATVACKLRAPPRVRLNLDQLSPNAPPGDRHDERTGAGDVRNPPTADLASGERRHEPTDQKYRRSADQSDFKGAVFNIFAVVAFAEIVALTSENFAKISHLILLSDEDSIYAL